VARASRPVPDAGAASPWVWTVEQWLRWDARMHEAPFYPERDTALRLRNRLAIALMLLAGVRGEELVAIQMDDVAAIGAGARDGRITIRDGQGRRIRPRTLPVGDIPGLAEMLRLYVLRARPMLREPGRAQASTLLLTAHGTRVIDGSFRTYYRRLSEQIFPGRRVGFKELRRASLGLLSEGLRVPLSTLAAVFGVSPAGLTSLAPEAPPREGWTRALRRSNQPGEVDRLLTRLRTWLDRLSRDFTG
jgi:integrase